MPKSAGLASTHTEDLPALLNIQVKKIFESTSFYLSTSFAWQTQMAWWVWRIQRQQSLPKRHLCWSQTGTQLILRSEGNKLAHKAKEWLTGKVHLVGFKSHWVHTISVHNINCVKLQLLWRMFGFLLIVYRASSRSQDKTRLYKCTSYFSRP